MKTQKLPWFNSRIVAYNNVNLYNKQFFTYALSCRSSTHSTVDLGLGTLNCRAFPSLSNHKSQKYNHSIHFKIFRLIPFFFIIDPNI